MELRFNLFLKEMILFGATMVIGLATAYRYAAISSAWPIIQAPAFSLSDIVFLSVLIAFFLIVTRFRSLARYTFWLFLILIILSGAQIVLGSFILPPWDVLGSFILLTLFLSWRNVLVHDITMIIALAGISAVLGLSITPTVAVAALVVLSFYDIIAVYKTRHMVQMARSMIQSGAIFGFVIPSDWRSFMTHRGQAQSQIGDQFMILGSGDIGLPIIFASSVMRQSLIEAAVVAVFAVLGVFVTHLLFANQRTRQAMAALPPIATMSLIGYVVALLIFK